MQYLGIEWGTRKAAWCALEERGEISGEGVICADEDGLAGLVHRLGANVGACVEMMSGAVWVRDRLAGCGWAVEIADARKAKAIAPLAGKTDRVDARVLAELVRRELVPALWVPSLADRGLRERLRRRSQLVRLRTSAINRSFGLLTQWGLRRNLTTLRKPGALEQLAEMVCPRFGVTRSPGLLAPGRDHHAAGHGPGRKPVRDYPASTRHPARFHPTGVEARDSDGTPPRPPAGLPSRRPSGCDARNSTERVRWRSRATR